jgi:hypothetical protein
MKKTVLTFGLISGAIMALMMFATLPFIEKIGFAKGVIIGYTTMVLSFLLVFFISRKRGRRDYHVRPGPCGRHSDHAHIVHLLRGGLGDYLLQIHARLCRQIHGLCGGESEGLWRQPGSDSGQTSGNEKAQGHVRQSLRQCSDHLHRAVSDRLDHYASLSADSAEEEQTTTRRESGDC